VGTARHTPPLRLKGEQQALARVNYLTTRRITSVQSISVLVLSNKNNEHKSHLSHLNPPGTRQRVACSLREQHDCGRIFGPHRVRLYSCCIPCPPAFLHDSCPGWYLDHFLIGLALALQLPAPVSVHPDDGVQFDQAIDLDDNSTILLPWPPCMPSGKYSCPAQEVEEQLDRQLIQALRNH
jgi:hypothetical protein